MEQGSLFLYLAKTKESPLLFVTDPLWRAVSLALCCKDAALDPGTNLCK